MSRHDFTRDPCPWRLVEDMGGAYSMGLVGGGIWAGGKVFLNNFKIFDKVQPSAFWDNF